MNTKVAGITFASTMLFATITSGLLLSSSTTHAADDSAVTVTEITVPSSCSMTANVSTPHVADIVNGNRAINIGKTTLSTFCNDPGGFAIYAIGYTNNELGATNVIATNNTDTIATGNTAPSNNSSWGMKVANSASSQFPATITPYFNVATNDGYVAVPSTFTLMASRNSGTAMDSATLLDTTYGAYISPTQPVGEYNGQVLYTMVHPSSAAGPNAETMFEAAFLMQPTPPTKKTVGSNSYYKMQDMTPDICTVMSIGAEGQMVDDRDDKIYWVLKAKDGKCWMTQNLDHDIVTTANYYTPANTDVDTNWTAINATTSTIDSNGNFTGWTDSTTVPYSANPGDWYYTDTYYNDACNSDPWCRYTNPNAGTPTTEKFSETPFPGNGEHGHVGNYYNWTAAVAMNNSADVTTGDVQTSICPAGWRLPVVSSISDNSDFAKLAIEYGAYPVVDDTQADRNLLATPLFFVRAGNVGAGTLENAGSQGFYWSSTAYNSEYAKMMPFGSGWVFPEHQNRKKFGFSVRCVARTETKPTNVNKAFYDANKTTVTINNNKYYKMQDMTPSLCSAIDEDQEGQLADIRDNKIYWILKAKDGHCWMTQNLDHNIVTTANFYTPQNTDVTANWTASSATITSIDNNGNFVGYSNSNVLPYSADPGNWYYTDTYFNNACLTEPWCRYTNPNAGTPTTQKYSQTPFTGNGKHGHVGNLYNWTAAIASNNSTSITSGATNSSICPSSWRLPSTAQNEFSALLDSYGANTQTGEERDKIMSGAPIYAVRTGNVYNGTLNGGGYSGYYWSNIVSSSTDAYILYYRYITVNPQITSTRYYGFPVRCIAK